MFTGAEAPLSRSSLNPIASVDPDALKIPARRAECSLTENAHSPFHAEPEQLEELDAGDGIWFLYRYPDAGSPKELTGP